MVKKSLFLILICIPILSGCKCSKHYYIKHQYNEYKKTECDNPPPPCVHHHEPLVTPYPGPLVSIDCPKESLDYHSKYHRKYHKKHHKSHDMTGALPPKHLQMPVYKPEHRPFDSWQQLVKLDISKCRA